MSYTKLYNSATREFRYTEFDATTTLALWTPRGSAAIAFDGLTITNMGAAGTFLLSWSYSSTAAPGAKIFTFGVGASSVLSPNIQLVEGTIMGAKLWGRPSSAATNSWYVTVSGFEIPQADLPDSVNRPA